MNIGIVGYPTFGGSGVVATELGKALAKKGHNIHFISYNQPARLEELTPHIFFHEVNPADYPLFDYLPYEAALSSKIVDVARFEKLDILHVHYAIPHASAAYMAKEILKTHGIHLPFITTLHGTDITLVGRDPSYEPVITFAINHSDVVTSVSESLKEDTYKHFKITREIKVIPNFVCTDVFKDAREKLSPEVVKQYAPKGEKILMHISNFRKVKRVEDVVYVFDKVRKKIPSKLLLVGDGPERQKVENLCRELGTCNDIYFIGKIKSTEHALAMADLFLLPSEFESFGLAALEAMASGVPVISSNTGGLPEVNQHSKSGFLANVGDVEAMANFAIQILENENTLKQFRKGAFEQALKFDIRKILPLYEDLYKSLIK
ncbi:MAG: N-acetyl-alpha-D-glucosaminyl L-malate synthase BshA [Bacteroidia bacterium]